MRISRANVEILVSSLEDQSGLVDDLLDAAQRWLDATEDSDADMRNDARDAREEMEALLPTYEASIVPLLPIIKRSR